MKCQGNRGRSYRCVGLICQNRIEGRSDRKSDPSLSAEGFALLRAVDQRDENLHGARVDFLKRAIPCGNRSSRLYQFFANNCYCAPHGTRIFSGRRMKINIFPGARRGSITAWREESRNAERYACRRNGRPCCPRSRQLFPPASRRSRVCAIGLSDRPPRLRRSL